MTAGKKKNTQAVLEKSWTITTDKSGKSTRRNGNQLFDVAYVSAIVQEKFGQPTGSATQVQSYGFATQVLIYNSNNAFSIWLQLPTAACDYHWCLL